MITKLKIWLSGSSHRLTNRVEASLKSQSGYLILLHPITLNGCLKIPPLYIRLCVDAYRAFSRITSIFKMHPRHDFFTFQIIR